MMHPKPSNLSIDTQPYGESLSLAESTSTLAKSHFNEKETDGSQLRHEGESYRQYMRRLYSKPLNRGIAAVRDPNDPADIKERWSFRPPTELTGAAYKFMRKHNMSITTYLTYAMHKLHSKTNS